MNKGLGLIILGGLAVLGGAVFAALVIKNKLTSKRGLDFDDFEDFEEYDLIIDDAEQDVKEKSDAEEKDSE